MGGFSGDRDGLTIARLSGHVSLVLHRRWPHDAAVASLRALTGDRADLLAQWQGSCSAPTIRTARTGRR